MAKRGFGFGMVMLLIVMAVVLILVAKAWKSAAPAAMDVHRATERGPLDDHGETVAAQELRSGELPRLGETQERTDEHAARVEEAMEAID